MHTVQQCLIILGTIIITPSQTLQPLCAPFRPFGPSRENNNLAIYQPFPTDLSIVTDCVSASRLYGPPDENTLCVLHNDVYFRMNINIKAFIDYYTIFMRHREDYGVCNNNNSKKLSYLFFQNNHQQIKCNGKLHLYVVFLLTITHKHIFCMRVFVSVCVCVHFKDVMQNVRFFVRKKMKCVCV